MKAAPEVCVTLSDELLTHLRLRATELMVPIEWLVAGLIYDTFADFAEEFPCRAASGA